MLLACYGGQHRKPGPGAGASRSPGLTTAGTKGISTMFNYKAIPGATTIVVAGLLTGGIVASLAQAQSAAPAGQPAAAGSPTRYQPNRFSRRAEIQYGLIWGIDSLSVKWAESGEMIRFAFRVIDAEKAKPLNDKKAEPSLIDAQAGVSLVIPSLEKVGQLRQSGTPEAGKSYWMAFSNKGRLVKRGDRVSVVIGNFRADGLVVD